MFRSIDNCLLRQPKYILCILSIVLVAILGFIDHSIGHEISFSIFYIVPILLATWYISRYAGIFMSIVAAVVWMTADLTSGHVYLLSLTPFWNAGVRLVFFLIITLLTSLVKKKLELEEALADTDYLTGLKNSRAFYERLDAETARSRRYKRPFTLAYMDLDNFKFINDTLGHDAGDAVLRTFSKALTDNVRQSDILSRLGGDEFAGLFPETDFEASEAVIQNLIPTITSVMKSANLPVTFSIGAVTFGAPLDTTREMIRKVDDLMYRVKKTGKNSVIHIEYNH